MRLRRYVRVLVLAVGLVTAVYVFLSAGVGPDRRRRRKYYQVPAHVVVFNEELYIQGESTVQGADSAARHAFNADVSNRLQADRPLSDSRHPRCADRGYNIPSTASVSVVIAFYNEARSTLLRTVMSVLNRSPENLLKEIVLVDDCSDNPADAEELKDLPKLHVTRNSKREGLIRSRARGASLAQGSLLMFLDSHCEVNIGWLEPLVDRAMQIPQTVASPVIDIIDKDSFLYKPSSADLRGGFDWSLHFKWLSMSPGEKLARPDPTEPFKSPIIPGGLFLVQKDWFDKLGGFDPGLEIWGAENLEISIKTWLCGGRVETVPCSRVGHVFRKKHPYTFPNGSATTYLHNSRRVAEVWLDEYRHFFYDAKPEAKKINIGSVDDRLAVKKFLKCKSFRWFLDNVYPELRFPRGDAVAFGQLLQGDLCLDSSTKPTLITCNPGKQSQEWSYSKDRELHTDERCLAVNSKSGQPPTVVLERCKRRRSQKWTRRRRMLVHEATGLCLDAVGQNVVASRCQRNSYSQQWDFSMELQTWEEG